MEQLSFLLWLLPSLLIAHYLFSLILDRVVRRTPPGPIPFPFLGNILIFSKKSVKSLTNASNSYGPIMLLRLYQKNICVLSSSALVKELTQKNDITTAIRPLSEAAYAHGHHHTSMIFLPYGPKWKILRKICNTQLFASNKLNTTLELRRKKMKEMITYLQSCDKPVFIRQVAFTVSFNFLSNMFFSVDFASHGSQTSGDFQRLLSGVAFEIGQLNSADFSPLIKFFSLQRSKRRVEALLDELIPLFNKMIEERLVMTSTKESNESSDDDGLDALLKFSRDNNEFDSKTIKHLLLDLFAAGVETTAATVEWAMTELLRNPDKFKRAQLELQDVIGQGNLVEESDYARLPYLQAVVKEVFRLYPASPLLGRVVNDEIKLGGFTIPKHSQLWVNLCAIGRDPCTWDNPNSFHPERFLPHHQVDINGKDFALIPFGAGRRICVGMSLAMKMIPALLGCLIHFFDWKLEGDTKPESIDMEEIIGAAMHKAQPLSVFPVNK